MMHRTPSIDFRTVTLQDALDLAMIIEDEAKERYGELAEQMEQHHNDEAADFFRFMRDMEARHEKHLKGLRARRFGSQPQRVHRGMIFDVEAPEYGEVATNMSARAALEAAKRSEQKAFAFFAQALEHVVDPEVKALFEELREEEFQHQQLLDAELERLPPEAPKGLNDALEDDPVAL